MTESTKNPCKSFKYVWLLLFLLVMAVLIVVGKHYWQQYSTDSKLPHNKTVELNAKLENLQQNVGEIVNARSEVEVGTQKQQDIKKAFVLTKMAADSLQYYHDVPLTVQLLQAAQNELGQSQDPDLAEARRILIEAQQKILAVKYHDVELISRKLDELEKLINVLAVKPESNKIINRKVVKTEDATPKWQQAITQVYESVKSSVTIRKKNEADLNTSLVINEYKLARFNLLLEQIRWASYYDNQVVYQRSIKETQDLLTTAFDPANPNVQQFKQTLDDLSGIQVHPVLPNLQDTVNALQALLVG